MILPSCKKEKQPPTTPLPTNSEKILGTWILAEELQDLHNDDQFVDVLQACDLDDTWMFIADGTLNGSQSGTTCEPGSPPGYSTHWELQNNETVLYLDYGSGFDEYKIAVLNDPLLVIHRPLSYNDINGKVYSRITYKR